jgi:inner membrane protein
MKSQAMQFYDRFYLVFRGIFVFFLILFLLIPQFFIRDLVKERKNRQAEVKEEIIGKWASEQTIQGPMLLVPQYKNGFDTKEGYTYIWMKPNELSIQGNMEPEVKHRSIYQVVLYKTKLNFTGSFKPISMNPNPVENGGILWDKAQMVMGITDYAGMEDAVHLTANKTITEFATNPYDVKFISAGLAAPIHLVADSNVQQDFSFSIQLKGYEQLNLQPFANKTKIELSSPWPMPSFTGRILPDNQVTEKGFTATWNVMDVRKTLPDRFTDEYATSGASENSMGVKLLQGQDHYSKTDRSIKYALLIITLTFVVYVFIELLQKKRINAAQYILVGAALLIFYTLLLSFSEYLGFDWAYLIAAVAVVFQISIYTGMVFRSVKVGFVFGILISVLYLFIFSLIQLEDYALLAGSVGLFFILSLVMFFSRKIAWTKNEKDEQLILKEETQQGPISGVPQ